MKKKLLKIFVAVIVAASVIIALIAIMNPTSQMPRRYKTENFKRGVELAEEGWIEESLTYFEAELKEHPKNPYAHLLIAMVYTELEKYDNAKVAIENAIKYNKENVLLEELVYMNNSDYKLLCESNKVIENIEIDYENVYSYLSKLEYINVHEVKPIYVKGKLGLWNYE